MERKGEDFIIVKCIKYYGKRLMKASSIIIIGLLIITAFICIKYKPLYKVTLNGEVIGYVENKEKMQESIEAFANNIEGNITSIEIGQMPEYELELVCGVKESETKEAEVLAKIEENSEIKCKTYAIKLDGNIKTTVNTKEEAEKVINEIKSNVTAGVTLNLEIEEQEKNKKEIDGNIATADIAKLTINQDVEAKVQEYEKQQEAAKKAEAARIAETRRKQQEAAKKAEAQVSSRSKGASAQSTGAKFMRPVSGGTITSKYGQRSSGFHTGLDIAISQGTPIYASAGGTVKFSGRKGGYGNLVIIDHGNGYQTYYAHCSALYVSAGQTVSQGENIAAVGSTGNSTGAHVHFEVRSGGSTLNPQNYI